MSPPVSGSAASLALQAQQLSLRESELQRRLEELSRRESALDARERRMKERETALDKRELKLMSLQHATGAGPLKTHTGGLYSRLPLSNVTHFTNLGQVAPLPTYAPTKLGER